MLIIRQIDPDISKKYVSYCKIPNHDRKRRSCLQNPTAGPQTYWAPRVNQHRGDNWLPKPQNMALFLRIPSTPYEEAHIPPSISVNQNV